MGDILKRQKIIKLIIVILILSVLLLPFLLSNQTAITVIRKKLFKATIVANGTTGTCNWTLDSDGLLLIEPTNGVSGTMNTANNSGFNQYSNQIISVKFNATVYAPSDCSGLFYQF